MTEAISAGEGGRPDGHELYRRLADDLETATTADDFARLYGLLDNLKRSPVPPAPALLDCWRLRVARRAHHLQPDGLLGMASRQLLEATLEEWAEAAEHQLLPEPLRGQLCVEIRLQAEGMVPDPGWLRGLRTDELHVMEHIVRERQTWLLRAVGPVVGGNRPQLIEALLAVVVHHGEQALQAIADQLTSRALLRGVDERVAEPPAGIVETFIVRTPGYIVYDDVDQLLHQLQAFLGATAPPYVVENHLPQVLDRLYKWAGGSEPELSLPFDPPTVHAIDVTRQQGSQLCLHLRSKTDRHVIELMADMLGCTVDYYANTSEQIIMTPEPDEIVLSQLAEVPLGDYLALEGGIWLYQVELPVDIPALIAHFNALAGTAYATSLTRTRELQAAFLSKTTPELEVPLAHNSHNNDVRLRIDGWQSAVSAHRLYDPSHRPILFGVDMTAYVPALMVRDESERSHVLTLPQMRFQLCRPHGSKGDTRPVGLGDAGRLRLLAAHLPQRAGLPHGPWRWRRAQMVRVFEDAVLSG